MCYGVDIYPTRMVSWQFHKRSNRDGGSAKVIVTVKYFTMFDGFVQSADRSNKWRADSDRSGALKIKSGTDLGDFVGSENSYFRRRATKAVGLSFIILSFHIFQSNAVGINSIESVLLYIESSCN